jgi:hypothetical protein
MFDRLACNMLLFDWIELKGMSDDEKRHYGGVKPNAERQKQKSCC